MTVQIITDERTARRRFIDRRETASSLNTDSQVSTDGYATVSIPDLRSRQQANTAGGQKFRYDGAHEPLFASKLSTLPEVEFTSESTEPVNASETSKPVSSLESIRQSIERTFPASNVDHYNREVDLHKLAEQLSEPVIETNHNEETNSSNGQFCSETVCLEAFEDSSVQVDTLVESILAIHSHRRPTIVAFASTENNEQLASIMAGVGRTLIGRSDERVLIVDSDFGNNQLTRALDAKQMNGTSELTSEKTDLLDVITQTSVDRLYFLPVGQKRLSKFHQCESAIHRVVKGCVAQFGLVLVNVGDAHDKAANIWSNHTDGSYLLISMKNSNKAVAKSAVSQLNSSGARLIGCIASDSSEV